MNLQTEQEQEQVCNNNNIGAQFDSFSGNNGLGPFGGVLYSSSIVEKEQELVCCGVVEINSSSSVGGVKEELEEECSRKR